MEVMEKLIDLANENDILTVAEAQTCGVSKFDFYKFIHTRGFEKIGHGIYAHPDTTVDPAYLLRLRCPNAVFSHDEALFYHGLVERKPLQQTITIYTGYNTKRLTDSGIKVFTVKKNLLVIGKTLVTDSFGNQIPMYDLERTICDLVRNRSGFELKDFQTALKTYTNRRDKNLDQLKRYAKLFHIDNVLRTYMEVLM